MPTIPWLPRNCVHRHTLCAGLFGLALAGSGCLKPYCEADTDCAQGQRCNLEKNRCEVVENPADGGLHDGGDGGADDAATGCAPGDCENPTPICDATSLECRGCDQDQECVSLQADRPWCDDGACVGCFDSVLHCADLTPICDATSLDCVACGRDQDCVNLGTGRPWCDGSACVECIDSAAHCTSASAAVCDEVTSICRPCGTHAECDHMGGVCDSGTCLAESQVLYVDDDATCGVATGTRTAPFCEISTALTAPWFARRVIRVADGTYAPITIRNDDVWILGMGGAASVDAGGAALETVWVTNGAPADETTARIEGITITGAGSGRSGLYCSTAISQAPTLTLLGSTISANDGTGVHINGCTATLTANLVGDNGGPGISASGAVLALDGNRVQGNEGGGLVLGTCTGTLSSNLISGNGTTNSAVGGIGIIATSGTLEILFNTIAGNLVSVAADEPGIFCANPTCPGILVSSNLFYNPMTPVTPDVSTAFTPMYCFIGTGDLGTGMHNITGNPGLVDQVDFRLSPSSPCRGAGDPGLGVTTDRDGDSRPQPSGSDPDIGADEVP